MIRHGCHLKDIVLKAQRLRRRLYRGMLEKEKDD